MSFLNPMLLFGLAAVAAPILIHLLMNRQVKKVVWAAMRFLQESVQKNKKRMRVEDLLLLALRCLLLVLLALALARPFFGKRGGAAAGPGGAQVVVIALDNSYSMGRMEGGTSRFDQAKRAGEQILDGLAAGSEVSVLLFSDTVDSAIAEPTGDLNLARKVIRDARLSDRATDVKPVVAQAVETLGRKAAGGKGIWVITDAQAAGWNRYEEIRELLTTPDIRSRVVVVGGGERDNLAVSDLRMATAMAVAGESATFNVEVRNTGTADATNVAVRLSLDDEAPSDEGVIDSLPAGASQSISLHLSLREPGFRTVTARIDPDQLPADDARTIAFRANDNVRILLVDGSGQTSDEAATFFVRNALTPVALSQRESYHVETKVVTPGELDATSLSDFEVILMADVAEISVRGVAQIEAFLDRGGGLIVFPGASTKPASWNARLGGERGILPAAFGEMVGKPGERKEYVTFQTGEYLHPLVNLWQDPSVGMLSTAQFYTRFQLKPSEADGSGKAGPPQIVLAYSDGSPAVVERAWGRGRAIQFSSTADTSWNDLALRPAFLPLIDRTIGSILDRDDERRNLRVGTPLSLPTDPGWVGRDALITRPGDAGEGQLRRISLSDGVPLLVFENTQSAGPYVATVKVDPPAVLRFAAISDPSESNLTILEEEKLAALEPGVSLVRWAPGDALEGGGGGGGGEIWSILAVLAVIVACVELALGGLFSQAK